MYFTTKKVKYKCKSKTMEKEQKICLLVNGPSCVGKSTLIKNILQQKEDYFHLSYDTIKWLFSKYHFYKHTNSVESILFSILKVICKKNHNIICDYVIHPKDRKKVIQIVEKYNYKIISINLEAPLKILNERFEEERQINIERKRLGTTHERFREIYDTYHKEKDKNAKTFDTGKINADSLAKKVFKILKN